jgi:kumamolisin
MRSPYRRSVKAHSYIKRPKHHKHPHPRPEPEPVITPWAVPALCAAYGWPTNATGSGVIAIVELGGGWNKADVEQFCKTNKVPVPTITDVSVDGSTNSPGGEADGEVALDIQVAAAAFAAATGGRAANIRMYWAQDIGSAVRAAAKDGCDVCSISWGADEAVWGAAEAADMEAAAAEAVAAGMVVFAAAGDNDSADGGPTPANVDLPAGCPHVVGCGGTKKLASSETVWNNTPGVSKGEGTGGGYSTLFSAQAWQIGAPPAPAGLGRMVPDVAANADPTTGYEIVIDGQVEPVGGTSAVAPLYAGLFAALGEKLGFVTPTLWQNRGDFNDITVGDNGTYHAQVGPDPCTGLGSPIGSALKQQFSK